MQLTSGYWGHLSPIGLALTNWVRPIMGQLEYYSNFWVFSNLKKKKYYVEASNRKKNSIVFLNGTRENTPIYWNVSFKYRLIYVWNGRLMATIHTFLQIITYIFSCEQLDHKCNDHRTISSNVGIIIKKTIRVATATKINCVAFTHPSTFKWSIILCPANICFWYGSIYLAIDAVLHFGCKVLRFRCYINRSWFHCGIY